LHGAFPALKPPAWPLSISLTINGEPRRAAPGSIADLVRSLELDPAKVAVERNGEIVPRSTLAAVEIAQGDVLEIVHFVGGGQDDDTWPDDPGLWRGGPSARA
jgi:thiazole synthase